jgi:hypothetical protein
MSPSTKGKNPYLDAMNEALKEALEACRSVEQIAKAQGRELKFDSSDIAAFALAVFKAKLDGRHA